MWHLTQKLQALLPSAPDCTGGDVFSTLDDDMPSHHLWLLTCLHLSLPFPTCRLYSLGLARPDLSCLGLSQNGHRAQGEKNGGDFEIEKRKGGNVSNGRKMPPRSSYFSSFYFSSSEKFGVPWAKMATGP